MSTNTNFGKLKTAMAAAGYPTSEGPNFNGIDLGSYNRYTKDQAFITGQTVNVTDAMYGLEYSSVLPTTLAANFSVGSQVTNAKLWAEAIHNGYMYVGTGNPVTNFQVTNGVSVQVGLSLRYYQNGVPPAAGDGGNYKMPKVDANNRPWTFSFSVASIEGVSLENYDVTLVCSLDTTGAATPVMSFALDGNTWVSTPSGSNITDSQGVENQVVQNIEQYRFDFLKSRLLPESMRSETVPYGLYTITLSAVGKADTPQEGDNASVKITANIADVA